MNKKRGWLLIIFLLLGCLAGVILTEFLSTVPALDLLTKTAQVTWEPKADFQWLKYDLLIQVKLNFTMLITMIIAVLLYRKI